MVSGSSGGGGVGANSGSNNSGNNIPGVGNMGVGVNLMTSPTSSLSSAVASHLQVIGSASGNQGVPPQASPQAPTYVNL